MGNNNQEQKFKMFKDMYLDEINQLLKAIMTQDSDKPEEFDFSTSASRLYSVMHDDYAEIQEHIDNSESNLTGLFAQIQSSIQNSKLTEGMVH